MPSRICICRDGYECLACKADAERRKNAELTDLRRAHVIGQGLFVVNLSPRRSMVYAIAGSPAHKRLAVAGEVTSTYSTVSVSGSRWGEKPDFFAAVPLVEVFGPAKAEECQKFIRKWSDPLPEELCP